MHPFSFLPHGCGFKERGPVSHRRPTVVGSGTWENNGCLAHVFKARDSWGFFGSFLGMATTLFTCFIFFSLLLQTHPGVLTSRRAGRQGSHCQIKNGNECSESWRTVWGVRVVIDSQSYLLCADSKRCCSSQSHKVEWFSFLFYIISLFILVGHEQKSAGTLSTKSLLHKH